MLWVTGIACRQLHGLCPPGMMRRWLKKNIVPRANIAATQHLASSRLDGPRGIGIVAAPGLFLEFSNGVKTTRIRRVVIVRSEGKPCPN